MKRIMVSIFGSVLILTITGCASMFSSKLSNIPVKTNPENAAVSVYSYSGGKIFEGKTPCVISLNKKEVVDGKVIITMKGYKDVQIILGRTIEPLGIANGCFFILPGFIIGGGIDYLNGNLVKPEIETINIILESETKNNVTRCMESDNLVLSRNMSVTIHENGSDFLLFIGQ